MARSESAGLQIALIIFVVLSLILGVTTILFFNSYKDMQEEKDRALADLQKAQAVERSYQQELEQLKRIIGAANDQAPLADVDLMFKDDMEKFVKDLPQDEWSYHQALESLEASLADAKSKHAQEKAQNEDLKEQLSQQEALATAQLQKVQDNLDTKVAEFQQEVQKFLAEKQRMTQEKTAQFQQLDGTLKQKLNELEELRKENNILSRRVATSDAQLEDASEQLASVTGETSQVPDGKIRYVDARDMIVWIDLGYADSLPPQQTFSVYDPSIRSVDKSTPTKGAIEVVRILKDHLAEARIVDYDIRDPILAGDKIATPVWSVGVQERYALGGVLDIDNDGIADNDYIKRLISISGGKVDAEVTPDGKVEGKIDLDTRYLIRGKVSQKAQGDAAKVADATNDMISDASRNGVRIISLAEFLEMIGFAPGSKKFRPGGGDEYNLDQGEGNGKFFRNRRPPTSTSSPAGGSGGAY